MNSEPEEQYWVICPFCHHPNRPGRHICSHCWSPRVRSARPVTTREMQQILKQYQALSKRRYTIKFASITFGSLILVIALVLLILLNFTDVLIRPSPTVNSSSLPGDWAMFRHDLLSSGASSSTDVLPEGKVLWTFQTDAAIQSSPAVVNGTAYIGSRDGKLYSIDTATGTKKWEFQTGSWVESSPAIVDGVVYFGSNDGKLYALDADTGQQLWSFQTPYPVKSAPAVVNGRVYFGADDGYVYALDAVTGKNLWQFKTTGRVDASPVIANGIVYAGSGSSLYALDAHNGRLRLNFESYYLVSTAPAVSDTTVYFGNSKGVLYAVDGNARNWLREHELKPYWVSLWLLGLPVPEPRPQSGSIWGVELGKTIYSSPAVVNGTAYVGVDNNIVAVDIENRETLWSLKTNDIIRSSPIVVGNTLYTGSNDGRLYAVDAATGQKLWDILTDGPIVSSAAIADGTLFVGSYDGKLYAIK